MDSVLGLTLPAEDVRLHAGHCFSDILTLENDLSRHLIAGQKARHGRMISDMKMPKTIACILMIPLIAVLAGCLTPRSFVQARDPAWIGIAIKSDLSYDMAWAAVMDVLVKKFDIEVVSKENGYIRTSWLYSWLEERDEEYRVRVTAKFSPDRSKLEMKAEAEYGGEGEWAAGHDTRLEQFLKSEIVTPMGKGMP